MVYQSCSVCCLKYEQSTFVICHNSAPTFFISFGFERRITEERVTSSVDGIGMQILLRQADNRSTLVIQIIVIPTEHMRPGYIYNLRRHIYILPKLYVIYMVPYVQLPWCWFTENNSMAGHSFRVDPNNGCTTMQVEIFAAMVHFRNQHAECYKKSRILSFLHKSYMHCTFNMSVSNITEIRFVEYCQARICP